MKNIFLLSLLFVLSNISYAEPTSGDILIVSIRPYQGAQSTNTTRGGSVYIQVDSQPFCGTNTFRIDMSFEGSKEMYAAAMSAMLTGKKVNLEMKPASVCSWGHELQSIYIKQ
jgi:hypothetical protein